MTRLPLKLAQFGDGFKPVTPGSVYTPDAVSEASVLEATVTAVSNAIGLLTIMAGLFFIAYFLVGALQWITSSGDSGRVTKARDQMLHATMGLAVAVFAYAIIGLIATVLGFDIFDLEENLKALIP